ncbi:MAG: efflux RND transporter periplasmic adaptor subunit [Candidatus Tagabacteria bacterium]
MKTFFQFIRRPLGIFLLILAAGASAYFIFIKKPAALPETIAAERGNVTQEVSVTGKTKPAKAVDLAFETAGKVKRINIEVGDKISSGAVLIELDSSELYAQLNQALADVDTQKANLDNLKKGAKPEEVEYYETKLTNAGISLEDAKKNIVDKIKDAYTKSEDAIRNKADQIFNNPRSSSPTLVFTTTSGLKVDIESGRISVESVLISWKLSIDGLSTSSDLNFYIEKAKNNLSQIRSFLEKTALAVNSLTSSSDLSQTTIDAYKSAVSTARTNVNTASTNLQSAEGDLMTAESNISLAEKELIFKKVGSTAEEISAQEFLVKKAEAGADLIRVKISKNILRSPMDGIIAKQEAKVGEIISANSIIVSVISAGNFELEANVPEADIAKIKIGDSARITLDAFGNDLVLEAKVTKIDPAEIVIEGVATYKTTLQFVKENEGIKSGMTTNLDILTAQKENVFILPQRAVIAKDGEKFVMILNDDGTTSEVPVKTGLRGSNGNIEIIEGIKEGDKIITSAK